MDVFVARQPIFDLKNRVAGYELLFRNGLENMFPDIDGDEATSTLLSNAFFSFGINELLREKPGFINFTRNLIIGNTPLLFPNNHVVIEVLEDIKPDPEVLRALDEFREQGYQVALDDFPLTEDHRPMIGHSDIIKIDFKENTERAIRAFVESLSGLPSPPVLLAEKLETHQDYRRARDMGFSLFQGYFFSKPEVLSKADIQAGQAAKLNLIREIQQRELDLTKIQEIIKKDVAISFKLLKFINSAYFYRPHPIDTIKDAITYLGEDELKKFLTIVTVSDLNTSRFKELLRRSVIRAGMCEKIGGKMHTEFSPDELFTLGLFSFMDALMNTKMEDIIEKIGFSDNMKNALLGKNKSFSLILHIIDSFERGQWERRIFQAITGKAVATKLPDFYLDAVKMSDSLMDTASL